MPAQFMIEFFLFALLTINLHSIMSDDRVRVDLFVGILRVSADFLPDAYTCEVTYKPVIDRIGSIVDLHTNYIASVDSTTETGFKCMHGQSECWGDIQQLCAYNYSLSHNLGYAWWDFIQCQDASQSDIPDNAQACAQQAGLDWNALQTCAQGVQGKTLMTNSIQFTDSYNVTISCTIFIQGQPFCIHNGYWYDCKTHSLSGIVNYICNAYTGKNKPPQCN